MPAGAALRLHCAADRQAESPAARETRAAVQEIDYAPECIAGLQSATLTWTQREDDRSVVRVGALTDADGLLALEGLLRGAARSEPAGVFAEGGSHELTLTCRDGAVIRLDVATDESGMLRDGEAYYAFAPEEPEGSADALYMLFGAADAV